MTHVIRLGFALLALGLTVSAQTVAAQTYPTKAVKMIVGFAPGGTIDVVARILGERMSSRLGQPFIVENRSGANGMLAAEAVARAEPDGHTIFVSNSSTITLNPTLFKDIRYSPERDFTPITTVVSVPLILAVNPENPKAANIKTVADLVAAAKQKPEEIPYGSAGNGNITHLAFELLSLRAGIKMIHVPYRGAAAAEVAALSQEVLAIFDTLSALQLVKAGKLRALAVSSRERLAALPDVPTMIEAGYPGFDVSFWVGLFVPKATPAPVVDLLYQQVAAAAADPAVVSRLEAQGLVSVITRPEFVAKIQQETKELADIVSKAGIRPE
ncbi:tripartite-type tricarboxylate transporter receptor subunit TctC [Bradyrhizobium sp. USDA 4369]